MDTTLSTTTSTPRIAIIADTSLQRHIVQSALLSHGFKVIVNTDPERLDPKLVKSQDIDAWIVDLSMEDQWLDFLDDILDNAIAPILFGEGRAPNRSHSSYPRWERRLFSKIKELVGDALKLEEKGESLNALEVMDSSTAIKIPLPIECQNLNDKTVPAKRVWVLAASLGGPAAVKLFIDCLPDGLPVAFVYAQHIDANFQEVLAQVLGRHSYFDLFVGADGDLLRHGNIVIAPAESEVVFSSESKVQVLGKPWQGPYTPSIDQVILNVAKRYGKYSGAVIFSGMGNDGAISSPQMIDFGGQVWTQSSETCANSSMPDSINATGCVNFTGTPQQLALQLVDSIRQEIRTEKSIK